MIGERVRSIQWIHSRLAVVSLEVDAIRPADDPDQLYFDPATVRLLERVQQLADDGKVDELAAHGAVYVRRSA